MRGGGESRGFSLTIGGVRALELRGEAVFKESAATAAVIVEALRLEELHPKLALTHSLRDLLSVLCLDCKKKKTLVIPQSNSISVS